MHVIGLVGGVASGKSFVTRTLCELGAESIDADQLAHQVLREPDVEAAVRQRWGGEVFGADGHIDRAALARIVFAADSETTDNAKSNRAYLEQLTHPRVGELAFAKLKEFGSRESPPRAIVLDVPLLLKAGWNKFCDYTIFVDAPHDVRLKRALGRGWSKEEFEAREAAQESLDEKRAAADVMIANAGSSEETREAVTRFWQSLPR